MGLSSSDESDEFSSSPFDRFCRSVRAKRPYRIVLEQSPHPVRMGRPRAIAVWNTYAYERTRFLGPPRREAGSAAFVSLSFSWMNSIPVIAAVSQALPAGLLTGRRRIADGRSADACRLIYGLLYAFSPKASVVRKHVEPFGSPSRSRRVAAGVSDKRWARSSVG